jgi:phosphate transport system substrate-binding protein
LRVPRRWIALLAALSMFAVACGGNGDMGDPQAAQDNGDGDGVAAGGDGDPADGQEGLSGELVGAGATFPTPLFQDWIFEYVEGVEPGVSINYQSIGSGGGIEQFIGQTVDFGSSERFLDDEALAEAEEERGCAAIQFPIVFGSVVIAFNDDELDELVLDAETIALIFDRQITNYNDERIQELNPDTQLPDQEIIPVHRSDGSGTTYVFTRFLEHEVDFWADDYGSGTEVNWASGTVGGQGNEGVTAGIQQNPGGLGYVNQAYALENDMPQARVLNDDDEPIYPTLDATTAASEEAEIPEDFQFDILDIGGEGYPITGTNWVFVWECGYDEDTAQMLKSFWNWALDEGDDIALELNYAPMGEDLKERVRDGIDRINAE